MTMERQGMAMKRRGFLAGAATLVAAAGGCITVSAAETTETHRYEIGDERVTVDNQAGDVTVRTSDREDLHVRAVKRDSMGNEDALSKLSVTSPSLTARSPSASRTTRTGDWPARRRWTST